MTLIREWILTFEVDRPAIMINCEAVGPRDGKNHAIVSYEFYSFSVTSVHTMFERVNKRRWEQVDLVKRARAYGDINGETPEEGSPGSEIRDLYDSHMKTLQTKGKFYTPLLEPGETYEARIFDDSVVGFDPNEDGADQPLKTLEVEALCDKQAEEALYGQSGLEMGGTFCLANVSALVPVIMRVWIGETPPVVQPDGTQQLPSPTAFKALLDLQPNHQHEFQPLRPGTPYHILVRLSDRKGRWQFIALTGTTKQRTATISFKHIHMINDSDNVFDFFEAEEAFYQFQIKESGRVRFYTRFPEVGYLPLGSGRGYNLPPVLSQSFGPKRILPGEEEISVAVHGYDHDYAITPIIVGVLLKDEFEEASGGTFGGDEFEPLWIPTGRGETVIDSETILSAKPNDTRHLGGELRFDVKVSYSITYV